MTGDYSKSVLVEQPAVDLFEKLGWETYDGFHEFETLGGSPLGREIKAGVVLAPDEQDLSEPDMDIGGPNDGDSGTI